MKRTWLWYLNFCALQWLCMRLARVMDGETQTGWTVIFQRPLAGWR